MSTSLEESCIGSVWLSFGLLIGRRFNSDLMPSIPELDFTLNAERRRRRRSLKMNWPREERSRSRTFLLAAFASIALCGCWPLELRLINVVAAVEPAANQYAATSDLQANGAKLVPADQLQSSNIRMGPKAILLGKHFDGKAPQRGSGKSRSLERSMNVEPGGEPANSRGGAFGGTEEMGDDGLIGGALKQAKWRANKEAHDEPRLIKGWGFGGGGFLIG